MKNPFFAAAVCFVVFAGLVFAASFSGTLSTEKPDLKQSVDKKADKNRNLPLFLNKEQEGHFHLTYGWKGFHDVSYLMTFTVSKKHVLASEEEVGYVPEELDRIIEEGMRPLRKEMISFLRAYAYDMIQNSPYAQYFFVEDVGSMSFNIKISAPREIYAEVKNEFSKITGKIAEQQEAYLKKHAKKRKNLTRSYIESRGLRYYGEKIGVNYTLCVKNNRLRIKPLVEKLKDLDPKKSLDGFIKVLLSFIQRIRYGIPPSKEGNKLTLGFWPPPTIFVRNLGDCDSKSVAFAALWTNFRRYPLLLIKIPNHMFIALAVPLPQDSGVVINGLRYVLFEVSGPDIWPPGLISSYSRMYIDSGRFSYEMIR